MLQVPLTNIPNQSLTIRLADNEYIITVQSARDNGESERALLLLISCEIMLLSLRVQER